MLPIPGHSSLSRRLRRAGPVKAPWCGRGNLKDYPQQDLHLHSTVFETAASAVGLCGLWHVENLLTGGLAPPTPRV